MGAYAIKVRSIAVLADHLRGESIAFRNAGAALVVPFPDELGAGVWVFAENSAALPWRT
jgi:hypothetical protein